MGEMRQTKRSWAAMAIAFAAVAASAGEFSSNGCRVAWGDKSLSVGNSLFTRGYAVSNGVLRTVSFRAAEGSEWQTEKFDTANAEPIAVVAEAAKWSPVGVEGLRVEVRTSCGTNTLYAFPGMPGVISVANAQPLPAAEHDLDRDIYRKGEWRQALGEAVAASDHISYGLRHVKATTCVCADQTDIRDQLLRTDERVLMGYDAPFTVAATSLDCRDILTGEGVVFVRIAPMPLSRPGREDDFIVDGVGRRIALLANGYPLAELAYCGGEAGRQRAVIAFQRALRPYRPGRDGVLLSNTWGAGNRDTRICQEFLLKEISAGAKIGVDVIQIDDGWQRGRSANSGKKAIAGVKKVWGGYWSADPLFWTADRERFPDGLEFLVARAKEKGMRFGLWFGPDSSDEAANWERDADWLLGMHRNLGIDYFKMDSMKLLSPLAFGRNRAMFDKMLQESGGAMVFDLDCTAEVRPGFFGLIDIGPLFVENRYTWTPVYWPHHALKNLWDLSHLVDSVRLRMEFCNPDTNHDKYKGSPLAHGNYRPDALFATVIAASPLAWMELSDVSEKSIAALAPFVRCWKEERDRWYGGVIHPVANRPDGVSWTGFVSEAADGGGYALMFRELSGEDEYSLDLRPIFGDRPLSVVGLVGGRGDARMSDGRLVVRIPEKLDFVWVKLAAKSSADSPFANAKPVWSRGMAAEMNSSVRFKAAFEPVAGAKPFLRITGTSAYRIRLNGRYVGYGPARSPKGFFRVDEWPLAAAMREGCNELEIDAAGYNCNSYYFQDQPAFLQAEVVADGKVLAATAADGGGFSAESTERMRKVPRYSLQRTFAEAYRYGKETNKLPLEPRPEVRYLERIASYPKFELNDSIRVVSRAKATYDPNTQAKGVFFIDTDGKNPRFKAFAKSELESNPWDEAQKIKFSGRVPCSAAQDAPISLRGGDSVRIDAGLNDCGFFGMKVKVAKPGRVLFAFDEVLADGEVDPRRMMCCNCVEWRFERPGAYEVETFEPYVWRYADLTAIDGDVEVSGLHVRAYKNPDAGRAAFRCSDPALERIFEAARETFVQNAVDVFTDCPSRERAGWLCDSFFIGRVNKLLTGDTKLERLFLQNYAIADEFEYIPKGAIPMCYPADHPKASFIPNWAMWLVIEVEEYLKRSGDRATVAALKPRLVAFVEYMKTFRNSDGLLEKLPSWVFVEWSQANKLVQDVNYPSNMTWAEVLDVMNRLYGMPELAAEAERVRETVRRQSWTGEWFCDNAVRQADGSLKLSGECTETCQYYAFFFRTATPKTYPRLWKTLVDDFGPKRLGADMKTLKSHPEIWPSNAFIGNYLRLECLAREGLSGSILDETKDFFLYMAERTGTLWEMISPTASCDHGFASHAAVYLFRDILGVKSVDAKSREVVVEPPKDLDLEWAEGTLPVSPTETVTVRWHCGEKPTVAWGRVAE